MTSSGTKKTRKEGPTPAKYNYERFAERSGIDVDELHAYLWKKSTRNGILLVPQHEIGKDLGLYPMAISRVFRLMESQGRLQISANMAKKWQIVDPEVWKSSP